MKVTIGAGSNLGDRLKTLEQAAQKLQEISRSRVRAAPVYTTPALLPENGPDSWRIPFLNTVFEMEWTGDPRSLLQYLKQTERELGRTEGPRWSPRAIDLDLLFFGDQKLNSNDLTIPHSELRNRAFVLDPLKDVESKWFREARSRPDHAPAWMAIFNLTPDSFSDGGTLTHQESLTRRLQTSLESPAQILDFGAESTRPGATLLTVEEEFKRLKPAFDVLRDQLNNRIVRPFLSVDTRHPCIARKAIQDGFDWINDVSGFADPRILEPIIEANATYILMHSLSVPADPKTHLSEGEDVVTEVKRWAESRLNEIARAGLPLNNVIFDPGIRFGKTPQQSITLLKRIDEFFSLPVRILVGHSRKGFLKTWTAAGARDRDHETLGVSMQLANRGVDYIRVHDADMHQRVFHAYREVR